MEKGEARKTQGTGKAGVGEAAEKGPTATSRSFIILERARFVGKRGRKSGRFFRKRRKDGR